MLNSKEKIQVYKISVDKGGECYCLMNDENVIDEVQVFLDYAEPGHNIHIEVDTMTRDEFHGLPEFTGF